MKTALIAACILALSAASASAVEFKAPPAASSLYTCTGHSLSKVAATTGAPTGPAPCCVGMMGCPQLLANTGLIRPKRDNRT